MDLERRSVNWAWQIFILNFRILINTRIELLEEKQANGAAEIRKALDESFMRRENWEKLSQGGIDWKKRIRYNRTFIAQLGVEVQVSSRSDLLIRDIVHLRNSRSDEFSNNCTCR